MKHVGLQLLLAAFEPVTRPHPLCRKPRRYRPREAGPLSWLFPGSAAGAVALKSGDAVPLE